MGGGAREERDRRGEGQNCGRSERLSLAAHRAESLLSSEIGRGSARTSTTQYGPDSHLLPIENTRAPARASSSVRTPHGLPPPSILTRFFQAKGALPW